MITILSAESTREAADQVYCHLSWMKQFGQHFGSNLAGFGGFPERSKAFVAILSPELLAYPELEIITWLTQDDDAPLLLVNCGIAIPSYLQDCFAEDPWTRGEKVQLRRLQALVMGAIMR